MLATVDASKQAISELPHAELIVLRDWYEQDDVELWDAEFEADIEAGLLDAFADEALTAFQQGHASEL